MTNDTETRELESVVKGGDVAMVTTLGPQSEMSSRPLTVAAVDTSGVKFLVDSTAGWVRDLQHSTVVNLSIAASGRNDWVSVSGGASLSKDRATIDDLWNAAAKAYFDGQDDPKLAVLDVRVRSGEFWSAPPGGPIGRLASVVGAAIGRPSTVGDHGDVAT